MRKNMQVVIEAFRNGKSKHEKTCRTDGIRVFSYDMLIAKKEGDTVFILPYEAAPTNTTRSQVKALQVSFPDAKTFPNF